MQLLKAIHVGKSHQPTQMPKLAKEYVFANARKDEEVRVVTCGIFYCRDSAKMKGCGSLQTSSWFDSEVLRNRQQKHTAIR